MHKTKHNNCNIIPTITVINLSVFSFPKGTCPVATVLYVCVCVCVCVLCVFAVLLFCVFHFCVRTLSSFTTQKKQHRQKQKSVYVFITHTYTHTHTHTQKKHFVSFSHGIQHTKKNQMLFFCGLRLRKCAQFKKKREKKKNEMSSIYLQ